ncbi:SIMPL domain-containing protein [Kingella sp. (in: b-proteobacteria)]|uniref:SIMPL domain-containing protein n=1 Tax=Kingella sp. (in: b-proteobacteria) TaxID=2020713 RepID=UPI0026DCFEA3|nr:SIMPL domain-containing protein [Kingella sp. (in: b-proteobacteria)]MDO4657466.1 SIMPL domain-containing protein [Kingella sp. (in: b-proteobacteria)]
MFKRCVLLVILAWAAPAMAEDLHYNVVAFSESASVRVPNDTMSVTLRVVESGAARETVSNKVTKRVNAVLARAKGNRAFEVESGSRSVYPEYDAKRTGIKGWTDSAEIFVKSTDFAALSKLVADSQQDAMLGDVSFSVSPKKYAAAVDEASEQALRSFRAQALNVSKTLGFSGYKIVRVELNQSFENGDNGAEVMPMAASFARSAKAMEAVPMDMNAGVRTVRQTAHGSVQMQ